MGELTRRYGSVVAILIVCFSAFWLLLLIVFPCAFLVKKSFYLYLSADEGGGQLDTFTVANYASIFSMDVTKAIFGVQLPLAAYVLLMTMLISCVITLLCLLFGYPLAFILARRTNRSSAQKFLLLFFVPVWVTEILIAFAWYAILSYQGALNEILSAFGVDSIRWLTGFNGIIVGLAYLCMYFMVLPIFNSMSTLEDSQLESALDMGASGIQIHRWVVIPHSKPGIASGCVMVFMLSAGSLFVPTLLGSPSSRWFTQVIQLMMFQSQDLNAGAAYSVILVGVSALMVLLTLRLFKVSFATVVR